MEFKRLKNANTIKDTVKQPMSIKYAVENTAKQEISTEKSLSSVINKSNDTLRIEYYPLAFGEKLANLLGRATIIFDNGITIRNILVKKHSAKSIAVQFPQAKMPNGAMEDIITVTEELKDKIIDKVLQSFS